MVPKGWDIKKIDSFCNVTSSKRIMQSDYVESGIPFYRSKEIILKSKGIEPADIIYIETDKFYQLKKKFGAPQEGDILISAVGTLGVSYLVKSNEEFYFKDGNLLWLRELSGIEQSFLIQLMKSSYFKNEIQNMTAGSSQKALTIEKLSRMKLLTPPLREQQKIANILSTWDKAISTTERLIDNSTQQKKALMQQLLTGKKRLLDDDGNRFAGEWETAPLKDCVTFLNGMRKPIKQEDRADIQGQYPYFGATGIIDYVNDYIFDDELILLGEDGENILSRVVPHVFMVSGKIWVNNHAHVMKANKDKNSEFLCIYLESLDYRKFNSGSAQPKINKAVCEKIPVHFPSLNEQNKIATVLTNADKEIELLEQQLADLQQEKKALMQLLLTGKKRVVVDRSI